MGKVASDVVNTSERLAKLRELMRSRVDAYVVPSEDQHSSEYLAHCDERRAFISGFNGSAGCAVITDTGAYMFTDGRYFLHAEKQLDKNWTLMKQGLPDVPTWQEFLYKKLANGSRIGIDSTLISVSDGKSLTDNLAPLGSSLVSIDDNLVDAVWAADRPPHPANKIIALDTKYSGQTHTEKIAKIRDEMNEKQAKATIVTMLDEVAWLFNLRGSDIDYNPVFFAYAIVTSTQAILFADEARMDHSVKAHLGDEVQVRPYASFFSYLRGLASELKLNANEGHKVILGEKASLAVATAIGQEYVDVTRSPTTDLKAIKNPTEIAGFRAAHIRDGAALARYFAWLEEQVQNGAQISESDGATRLAEFRKEGDLFQGLSFETISSTGPNGAIIHYAPNPEDCAVIKRDQIYLCDSGAQYLDGTTDVTRTWHFGKPNEEERRAFTRVLQGHIAIDTAIFPNGTTGYIIDSFARRPLWEDGLDYRHGTGHGVGHFLNVHEGPHGIGVRIAYNSTALKAGMTVSNEPGYYADGKFGIRIENVVVVREANPLNNFGNKGFLGFENFTMCPIQKKLVEPDLLSAKEIEWLDAYHAQVRGLIAPLLAEDPRALAWLERECSPM